MFFLTVCVSRTNVAVGFSEPADTTVTAVLESTGNVQIHNVHFTFAFVFVTAILAATAAAATAIVAAFLILTLRLTALLLLANTLTWAGLCLGPVQATLLICKASFVVTAPATARISLLGTLVATHTLVALAGGEGCASTTTTTTTVIATALVLTLGGTSAFALYTLLCRAAGTVFGAIATVFSLRYFTGSVATVRHTLSCGCTERCRITSAVDIAALAVLALLVLAPSVAASTELHDRIWNSEIRCGRFWTLFVWSGGL